MKSIINYFFISVGLALSVGKTEIIVRDPYIATGAFLFFFACFLTYKWRTYDKS